MLTLTPPPPLSSGPCRSAGVVRARAATAARHVRPHVIAPRSDATPLSPGVRGAAAARSALGRFSPHFHPVSVSRLLRATVCVYVGAAPSLFSFHGSRALYALCGPGCPPRARRHVVRCLFPGASSRVKSRWHDRGRAIHGAAPAHTRTCPASSPPGVGASQRRRAAPLECTRFEAGVTSTARSRF